MEEPPQPQAILRGHAAQVHAARFIRGNERLVTGDAEGFVVVWDLTVMRARAVWRAHQKTILGIEEWGPERLITYVRIHRRHKLNLESETKRKRRGVSVYVVHI